MSKKKEKIVCTKCMRDDFKSRRGLSNHDTRMHPYIPPPPPEKTHHSFASIVRNSNWGMELTKMDLKHPSDRVLAFAYQARTVELLEQILAELKRPKNIV